MTVGSSFCLAFKLESGEISVEEAQFDLRQTVKEGRDPNGRIFSEVQTAGRIQLQFV